MVPGARIVAPPQLLAFDASGFAPTYTFPLRVGSPAYAGVPAGQCNDAFNRPVQTDQRNYSRGVFSFGANSVPAACAMGAYEGFVDQIFANGFELAF